MAESVDALVSNTNGAIRAGSIPALGTEKAGNHGLPAFKFNTYRYITNLTPKKNVLGMVGP